ncbi:MAG TPA: hypothetical protein VJ343_02790, partial [archaeon]|nr:hypothetical protein [archaeon]
MPDEITGSRAGDTAGSVFQRNISKPSIDWSKGGAEHFSGFKESLGEVGKDKSFEPIKDFHGLGKTFVDAQKMIGGSLRLPKEGATPEERKKSVDEIMTKLRGAGIM